MTLQDLYQAMEVPLPSDPTLWDLAFRILNSSPYDTDGGPAFIEALAKEMDPNPLYGVDNLYENDRDVSVELGVLHKYPDGRYVPVWGLGPNFVKG